MIFHEEARRSERPVPSEFFAAPTPSFLMTALRYRLSGANRQAQELRRALCAAGARVVNIPYLPSVYGAALVRDNAVLVERERESIAFLGKFRCPRREAEQRERIPYLSRLGFRTIHHAAYPLDASDVVLMPNARAGFVGYGARTVRESVPSLEDGLQVQITPLHLVDVELARLDAALFALDSGVVLACREAFDDESWRALRNNTKIRDLIRISHASALAANSNLIEVGGTVIVGGEDPDLSFLLRSLGKKVVTVPLNEIQVDAGTASCVVTRVHRQTRDFAGFGRPDLHMIS